MPQVQIDDRIFVVVKTQAAAEGYSSVDEFISDVLIHNLDIEPGAFDHVFTRARLDELQKISSELKAGGKAHTAAEVDNHFENRRKAWLANHRP